MVQTSKPGSIYDIIRLVMKYPDANKHFWASMTKSVIRIAGYCLIPVSIEFAAAVLIASEVIGVLEELV